MNNGVDNQTVAEPVLIPLDSTATNEPNTVINEASTQNASINNAPIVAAPVLNTTPTVQPNAPVVVSPQTVSETVQPPTIIQTTDVVLEDSNDTEKKKEKNKKKKFSLSAFLFLLLIGLGVYTFFVKSYSDRRIDELSYQCSPRVETKEEVSLDLNSTLVQDLYKKVSTSIREDLAQPEWNDTMKMYLAFRQIPDYKIYDSNCNMFDTTKMEPYTCEVSVNFIPKAFHSSTLELEWKKLFGEMTPMPKINIKLENSCIGGYEYIPERDEYVQGYCKQSTATSYKVTKTLTEATSSNNMIILKEDVKYAGNEKMTLPDYLKSGTYYYTFRLDMNYNYVLIQKTFDQKY